MAKNVEPYMDMTGFLTYEQRRAAQLRVGEIEQKNGECQFCGGKIGHEAATKILERYGVLVCGNCQINFLKPYDPGYLAARQRVRDREKTC